MQILHINTLKHVIHNTFNTFVDHRKKHPSISNDLQECPIVIADWIYDLSKVNLSDAFGNTPWNKPAVKLNYDPLNNSSPKKHVAGNQFRN